MLEKHYYEVLCIKSGDGFRAGEVYAGVRGAYNNGNHIVRSTRKGDVFDLLVHNFIDKEGEVLVNPEKGYEGVQFVYVEGYPYDIPEVYPDHCPEDDIPPYIPPDDSFKEIVSDGDIPF